MAGDQAQWAERGAGWLEHMGVCKGGAGEGKGGVRGGGGVGRV